MNSWISLYQSEINEDGGLMNYYKKKIISKKKMIEMITCNLIPNDRVLEAGCGTGIITTYLASLGYECFGMDIDEDILNLACTIADQSMSLKKPKFIKNSILNLNYSKDYFKVVFSSGVLEHFSDDDIIKILSKQLWCAKYVVVLIPTSYFNQEEAMHGDERFMPPKKWRELIKESGGVILKEEKCHYLKAPYRWLNLKKTFRGWPYRIFMIENTEK